MFYSLFRRKLHSWKFLLQATQDKLPERLWTKLYRFVFDNADKFLHTTDTDGSVFKDLVLKVLQHEKGELK